MELDLLVSDLADTPTEAKMWRSALSNTKQKVGWVFPSTRAHVRFAMSFSSPEEWFRFAALMSGEEGMALFLTSVDASAHSPEEWIAALEVLHSWLGQKAGEIPMARRIGYLSCCAEAASTSQPVSNLADFTAEMLDDYGLE